MNHQLLLQHFYLIVKEKSSPYNTLNITKPNFQQLKYNSTNTRINIQWMFTNRQTTETEQWC